MTYKIVVIDDDVTTSTLIRETLHRLGDEADVMVFNNAREGLQHVLSQKPDLLITDLRMPIIDGWTLAETIRNTDGVKQMNIMALTASGTVDEKRMERVSFDSVMIKPFLPQELLREVKNFMGKS